MKLALIQPKFQFVMPYRLTPLSLGIIGTLSDKLFDVDIIDSNFDKIDYNKKYDLVALGITSFCAEEGYKIADKFRSRGVKVIFGGIHPTLMYEDAKNHCDCIVTGEVEEVWSKVLQDFVDGRLKKKYVGKPIDMRNMPIVYPKFRNKLSKGLYDVLLIQATRGCGYDCDFCSVTKFYGPKIRSRPVADIVKEIKVNKAKRIFFVDDNLVCDFKYATSLFKAMIPLKIKWGAQVPISFAKNKALVKLAKKSGCRILFVGIESVNQESINEVSNKCKVNEYASQIKILRENGIMVWAGFIFGFDNDTKSVFKKTLDFCYRTRIDLVNFHPLAAFPGTRLYYRMKKENRLVEDYLVKPKNFKFDHMMYRIMKSYKEFYSLPRIMQRTGWKFGKDWNRPMSVIKYLLLNIGYARSMKEYK